MKRIFLTLLSLVFFAAISMSAPAIYQAENGVLNGTVKATALAGYQGTGYVDGWDTAGDSCAVTVNVPAAGMYTITIGYAATMGDKINDLYVNGIYQIGVSFLSSTGFTSVNAGMVPLNAGNNEIKIVQNWGWFYLDWIGVEAATLPPLSVSRNLVNANSTAATKCLFSSMVDSYGANMISGQCGGADVTWINTTTAHYPVIQGFDMMDYSPSRVAFGVPDPMQVEQAIAWYQAGGIVQFQWHWNAPSGLINTTGHEWWRGFYTDSTTFDVENAMNNPGSADYNSLVSDIDAIAVQLKRLSDAGVPVLWRPLHEAEGGWFWWGAKGYGPCVALYHIMYDRLVNYHRLNNLIWVWTTSDDAAAANWYPGDAYADIVGADIYLAGLNYSPSTGMFYNIVNLFGGKKMVALTETGTIPDTAQAKAQKAGWDYFMTWNGFEEDTTQNSVAHVQAVYGDSYVINRDDLANIYNCGTPTFTGTFTPTCTRTFTPSYTRTITATYTKTFTPTYTGTQTATLSPSASATFTSSLTVAATRTFTQSATLTNTPTAAQTQTNSATASPSMILTETNTPVYTVSSTPTATLSATSTAFVTLTPEQTDTPAATFTETVPAQTSSPVITPSFTAVPTATTTSTPKNTWTNTPEKTFTATFTITPAVTQQATATATQVPEAQAPAELIPYPNPYNPEKGDLKILVQPSKDADIVVKIYTRSYRLIIEKNFTVAAGAGTYISISGGGMKGLSNGLYFFTTSYKYNSAVENHKIGMFFVVK